MTVPERLGGSGLPLSSCPNIGPKHYARGHVNLRLEIGELDGTPRLEWQQPPIADSPGDSGGQQPPHAGSYLKQPITQK